MKPGGTLLVRLALLSQLGALAVGCAHTQLVCPRQAGPEWRQYDSRHFSVTTDLPPARARPLVGAFERTYRSFVDVTGWHFPGRGEPPGRMRVIVFTRRAAYDAIAPPRTDGFYRPESLEAESAVVIDNNGTQPPGAVFLHELTHRLIRYYVPNTPLGLNEGLAEYFSTFVAENGTAQTGFPPRRLVTLPPGTAFPPIRVLLTIDSFQHLADRQIQAVYVGGWFLVHTMARFYPSQLGVLLGRMADGDSFNAAFVASFGADGWTELERHYVDVIREAYTAHPGRLAVPSWRKPYQPAVSVEPVVEEEWPIGDAGLHLLWAELEPDLRHMSAQVALAEAHGGDSAQLAYMRALVHLHRNELPAAAQDLAAAIEARPEDERYRLTLARVYGERLSDDKEHALAAMAPEMTWLAAHAQAPDSLALVALYDAIRGDLPSARKQVQRALAADPTSVRAYYALAIIAATQGDIDGAIAAAERSLHLTTEGAGTGTIKALLDKLRQLRARRDVRSASGSATTH